MMCNCLYYVLSFYIVSDKKLQIIMFANSQNIFNFKFEKQSKKLEIILKESFPIHDRIGWPQDSQITINVSNTCTVEEKAT